MTNKEKYSQIINSITLQKLTREGNGIETRDEILRWLEDNKDKMSNSAFIKSWNSLNNVNHIGLRKRLTGMSGVESKNLPKYVVIEIFEDLYNFSYQS